MTAYVRLEIDPSGISIDEAAEDMVTMSKALKVPTMAPFNGLWLRAEPSMTPREVVKQYLADVRYRRMAEIALADGVE